MSSKTAKTGTPGLRRGKRTRHTHQSITLLLADPEEREGSGANASLARVVRQGEAEM